MIEIMNHPEQGALQSLIDGELAEEERGRIARHLAGCGDCRREAAELRSAAAELSDALRLLSHSGTENIVRLRPGDAGASRGGTRRLGWWGALGALPRAAVLVFGFAGAAAALPGSPVHGWLRTVLAPDRSEVSAMARSSTGAEAPVAAATAAETGVSIAPERGAVRVVLADVAPEVVVNVLITEGPRAGVYAMGAATDAGFRMAPGRIEVLDVRGGELRVELPHAARDALVSVNGRRFVIRDGDRLRLLVEEAGVEASATDVTFQARQR